MLAEFKRRTNWGVGLGFLAQIIGKVVIASSGFEILGDVIALVGFGLFLWGCACYARGKGYSPWFGLFGLLWIIGLVALFFLPDKYKETKQVA